MKILQFKPIANKGLSENKKEIFEYLEAMNSFIVIGLVDESGKEVEYMEHNIDNGEVILACEVVKAHFLNKVVV